MTVEIIVAGSSFAVALVAVGGVVVTWRKNGKAQAARDQMIADNQQHIIGKLDNKETGLTALNQRFQNFEINFTDTRSRFDERLKTTERDIDDLKHKPAP